MDTIRKVVDDALELLGEVKGPGVAFYSEDRMMSDAIRSFNLLFKKYYWPHMLQWFRFQLDGTLGIPPADTFQYVRDIEDICGVYKDGQCAPMPAMPKNLNPFSRTGNGLNYWSFLPVTDPNFENRYLQFYNKASTEFVNVQARVYPRKSDQPWGWDDVLPLDKDMLVYGTAFMTLSADDINSVQADTQRNMMEMRYRDILATFANTPLSAGSEGIPNEWFAVR